MRRITVNHFMPNKVVHNMNFMPWYRYNIYHWHRKRKYDIGSARRLIRRRKSNAKAGPKCQPSFCNWNPFCDPWKVPKSDPPHHPPPPPRQTTRKVGLITIRITHMMKTATGVRVTVMYDIVVHQWTPPPTSKISLPVVILSIQWRMWYYKHPSRCYKPNDNRRMVPRVASERWSIAHHNIFTTTEIRRYGSVPTIMNQCIALLIELGSLISSNRPHHHLHSTPTIKVMVTIMVMTFTWFVVSSGMNCYNNRYVEWWRLPLRWYMSGYRPTF